MIATNFSRLTHFILLAAAIALITACGNRPTGPKIDYGMVIHGGAGTILRANMTPENEAAYRAKMTEALKAGYAVLQDGGSALDAVQATIVLMENSPLFNAGKGAVFNSAGVNEMDACIMDGRDRNVGAVTVVRTVKNPIKLARLVLDESPHVLLAEDGATEFAREHGLELVEPDYFFTQRRWDALQNAKEEAQGATGHGTVGAVALDQAGNIAAATSTGGMTNKRFGRIGDTPIAGAGTYADNNTCGVSGTGHGEYFIRAAIAFDISARMQHGGQSLAQAANDVIHGTLTDMGGTGGVVALDKDGNIAMPFNTSGMYRGYVDQDGNITIAIYKDE
ncbi:isoaspartyl peptidase/L-asparaginase family protein [Candidatus Neomarinimicrobiota bacterium]